MRNTSPNRLKILRTYSSQVLRWLKCFKIILRQRDEDVALAAIAQMEQGQVIALDSRLSIDAAYYGVKYKLPLADSIIYATAMKYDAIIWTQDNDFESLNGVRYFPKIDNK